MIEETKDKEEVQKNGNGEDEEIVEDKSQDKDQQEKEREELVEEIEGLKEELKEVKEEKEEYHDRLLHLQADFENYKKRQREKTEARLRKEREKLIEEFIPIYDNLTRALKSHEENEEEKSLIEGIEKIYAQFDELLDKKEIEPMDAEGEKFDPSKHEALMKIESDEYEDNEVIEEFEKGYYYEGQVLKPSKVKVNVKSDTKDRNEDEKSRSEKEE